MNYQTVADSPPRSQQQHQRQQQQHLHQQQEVELDRKKLEDLVSNKKHNECGTTPITSESHGGEYLSFCGCGFLGMYHVGVSSCINQYAPQMSLKKIAGSSVGAIVAVAHISGAKHISDCLNAILNVALKARERALGPFHPSFNVNELVYNALDNSLSDDVHKTVTGILHISLTRVEDGQNVIISQFDSKEDVIQALICSSFIPFWSGFVPPKYKGVSYMDGGFSNNLLKFEDPSTTITVSPFAGEADICPKDDYLHLLQVSLSNTSFSISPGNIYRVFNSLIPPPPEALSKLYNQGFNDALAYLRERKQLACIPCVPLKLNCIPINVVQSSSPGDSTTLYGSSYSDVLDNLSIDDDDDDDDDETEEDEDVSVMLIPVTAYDTVTTDINNNDNNHHVGCICTANNDSQILKFPNLASSKPANQGITSWFTQSRPVKFLTWITTPCYIPIDVAMIAMQKIWQTVPNIRKELLQSLYNLLTFLQSLAVKRKGSKFEIILGGQQVPIAAFKSKLEADIMSPVMSDKSDISNTSSKSNIKQSQSYSNSNNNVIHGGNYMQHNVSERTRSVSIGNSIDQIRLNSYAADNHVNSIDSSDNDKSIINKPNSFVSHGSSRSLYQQINDEIPCPLESA